MAKLSKRRGKDYQEAYARFCEFLKKLLEEHGGAIRLTSLYEKMWDAEILSKRSGRDSAHFRARNWLENLRDEKTIVIVRGDGPTRVEVVK
jgi:hypothetical protein